jgi:hypothetical protein
VLLDRTNASAGFSPRKHTRICNDILHGYSCDKSARYACICVEVPCTGAPRRSGHSLDPTARCSAQCGKLCMGGSQSPAKLGPDSLSRIAQAQGAFARPEPGPALTPCLPSSTPARRQANALAPNSSDERAAQPRPGWTPFRSRARRSSRAGRSRSVDPPPPTRACRCCLPIPPPCSATTLYRLGANQAMPCPFLAAQVTLLHNILKWILHHTVLRASGLEPPLHPLPGLAASSGITTDLSASRLAGTSSWSSPRASQARTSRTSRSLETRLLAQERLHAHRL